MSWAFSQLRRARLGTSVQSSNFYAASVHRTTLVRNFDRTKRPAWAYFPLQRNHTWITKFVIPSLLDFERKSKVTDSHVCRKSRVVPSLQIWLGEVALRVWLTTERDHYSRCMYGEILIVFVMFAVISTDFVYSRDEFLVRCCGYSHFFASLLSQKFWKEFLSPSAHSPDERFLRDIIPEFVEH